MAKSIFFMIDSRMIKLCNEIKIKLQIKCHNFFLAIYLESHAINNTIKYSAGCGKGKQLVTSVIATRV